MQTAEARIAEGFAEPADDWCRLASLQSLYLGRPYLAYASRDHGPVVRAEARSGGELLLGVTGWVSAAGGHPYLDPRALLELPTSSKPDLVLGCPGAFSGDMLLVPAHATAEATRALQTCLLAHARELALGDVLALYADPDAVDVWSEVTERPPALVSFDTVIDVPSSFDEWIEERPRQRRSSIRRELRAFEQTGLQGGVLLGGDPLLPDALRELAPILVSSEARFGNAMQVADVAALLERQRLALANALALFYVRDREGRLVAGATAFLDAHTVNMRWGGVDRVNAGDNLEYFHVAYYLPLRFAASSGRVRMRLGMESYEAKILRGARLEPRFVVALSEVDGWETARARTSEAALARLRGLLSRFPRALAPEAEARLLDRLQSRAILDRKLA